jgi:predicted ester cyclase
MDIVQVAGRNGETGHEQENGTQKGKHHMSTVENKALFQRMIHLMVNGDLNTVDQIITPNWVDHTPPLPSPLQGYEGFKQLAMLFRSAFPDMRIEIEDILAEGDKVAARMRLRGRNTGSFQGMPPTGKAVDVTATGIFRVVDGKATDNWVTLDALGLLQQLGVVPAPG